MLARLVFTLSVLCLVTPNPATALTDTEAENCVLGMAETMQQLPNSPARFEAFVTANVDLNALTAKAVGRDWKNLDQYRTAWKRVAMTEIVEDTIPTLRSIEIGDISHLVVSRVRNTIRVSGLAGDVEVNVFVDTNCRIVEANAAQVSASGKIRERIEATMPRN